MLRALMRKGNNMQEEMGNVRETWKATIEKGRGSE